MPGRQAYGREGGWRLEGLHWTFWRGTHTMTSNVAGRDHSLGTRIVIRLWGWLVLSDVDALLARVGKGVAGLDVAFAGCGRAIRIFPS